MTPDFSKARLVVDEYISELTNQNKIPGRIGRTWIEFCMQRSGLISDVRAFRFGESHALWYACIVKSRSLTRVANAENLVFRRRSQTKATIKKLIDGRMRDTVTAGYLREFLIT